MSTTEDRTTIAVAALLGVLAAALLTLVMLAIEPAQPPQTVQVIEYVTTDDFSASNRLDV